MNASQFLVNRDATGRYIVVSYRTGKKYFVETIANEHTPTWGDVNPATKKVEGAYGLKYPGGIKEKDSLIMKENGFKNIVYSGIGGSPEGLISELDAKYPTIN